MRRIQTLFWGFFGGFTVLWAMSAVWPTLTGFFVLRGVAVDYTGMTAMAVMSAGMILALRPATLEPLVGGLDKGYRLHKWLGIAGLVLAVTHWLWAQGPKWLVGLGWLARPERHGPAGPLPALEAFLRSQRGLAEGVGEWAFYAVVALIVLALIKAVPYHLFRRLHRLFPVAYLALVFHALLLTPVTFWTSPVGPVMGLLMGGGVVAAVASLAGAIGRYRRAGGVVEAVERLGDDVLRITMALDAPSVWRGHQAGQFALIAFDDREGAHPFTIASAWTGDGRMTVLVKALGDYTRTLVDDLSVGRRVTVEGPYGRFVFDRGRARQIWVAGGIGITPFLARLEALAARGAGNEPVDLIYTAAAPEPALVDRLQRLSAAAGVRLHVLSDARDGLLTTDRLKAMVPDWWQAEVWFCGPGGFARALRRGLGPLVPVHRELFEMR